MKDEIWKATAILVLTITIVGVFILVRIGQNDGVLEAQNLQLNNIEKILTAVAKDQGITVKKNEDGQVSEITDKNKEIIWSNTPETN